jgi:hypothetical protein
MDILFCAGKVAKSCSLIFFKCTGVRFEPLGIEKMFGIFIVASKEAEKL